MHQNQITLQHPSAMHPQSMQVSAGLPPGHFLPSPALASPVGSTGAQQPNPPLAANAPCSTLFVANLGQFVSEHELKEIFARGAGMEPRPDLLKKQTADHRDLSTYLMATT